MSNQEDLCKENDQQTKTIRHLQTRIKLLEKLQNDVLKTTNRTERDNKALKLQVSCPFLFQNAEICWCLD